MWKVKRMNTARIVVLTIAIGAGGIAATLASGRISQFAVPVAPIAQMATSNNLRANGQRPWANTALAARRICETIAANPHATSVVTTNTLRVEKRKRFMIRPCVISWPRQNIARGSAKCNGAGRRESR